MALSEAEVNTIENRFLALESKMNDFQTALNNVASKATLNALLNIRQAEVADLQTKVIALESRIAVLESA